MFFNTPPQQSPPTYITSDISVSECSDSPNLAPFIQHIPFTQDLSITPPLFSPNQNAPKIPLTTENLRKHNELMNKRKFEKKYTNINSITNKKITDDFNSPVTINQLINFVTYYVNKKNLPENKKNNLIFSIFKNIIKIKEKPLSFNKKDLICTYVYLDRIYNRFNDFKNLSGFGFKKNTKKTFSHKYCDSLTLTIALLKTISLYKKYDLMHNYMEDTFYNVYNIVNEEIGDGISYSEYNWYSENFFI